MSSSHFLGYSLIHNVPNDFPHYQRISKHCPVLPSQLLNGNCRQNNRFYLRFLLDLFAFCLLHPHNTSNHLPDTSQSLHCSHPGNSISGHSMSASLSVDNTDLYGNHKFFHQLSLHQWQYILLENPKWHLFQPEHSNSIFPPGTDLFP